MAAVGQTETIQGVSAGGSYPRYRPSRLTLHPAKLIQVSLSRLLAHS